jgi:hypothetical protein
MAKLPPVSGLSFWRIKAPQSWGEFVATLVFISGGGGYLIHEHERMSGMEKQLADRPMLMERRDRESDSLHEDIRELRSKLLCPCHE